MYRCHRARQSMVTARVSSPAEIVSGGRSLHCKCNVLRQCWFDSSSLNQKEKMLHPLNIPSTGRAISVRDSETRSVSLTRYRLTSAASKYADKDCRLITFGASKEFKIYNTNSVLVALEELLTNGGLYDPWNSFLVKLNEIYPIC